MYTQAQMLQKKRNSTTKRRLNLNGHILPSLHAN